MQNVQICFLDHKVHIILVSTEWSSTVRFGILSVSIVK